MRCSGYIPFYRACARLQKGKGETYADFIFGNCFLCYHCFIGVPEAALSGNTGRCACHRCLIPDSSCRDRRPGGMPIMVYLMCITHAASMVSPTHVCLVVASDYFHVTLGELVRKTLPVSLAFCALMTVYYNILLIF